MQVLVSEYIIDMDEKCVLPSRLIYVVSGKPDVLGSINDRPGNVSLKRLTTESTRKINGRGGVGVWMGSKTL